MAGFQVAINGRFWVATEVRVLRTMQEPTTQAVAVYQVPVLCYLGFFVLMIKITSRGFQIVDALRHNRWRARGNMDRMAPAVVFELYFLFGRFTVVLHLDPIFSLAIAEGDDEPRPIFRNGGFN